MSKIFLPRKMSYLGGVSECKVRDAVNVGGEFDE